jgi:hypothetical protein
MDQKNYIHSLELLAELYSQMGDSSLAYAMQRKSKEFADSLASAYKASQMADWQMKFDEQKQEKKFLRQFVKLGGGNCCLYPSCNSYNMVEPKKNTPPSHQS